MGPTLGGRHSVRSLSAREGERERGRERERERERGGKRKRERARAITGGGRAST